MLLFVVMRSVNLLIKGGANLNSIDKESSTLVMRAAEHGKIAIFDS